MSKKQSYDTFDDKDDILKEAYGLIPKYKTPDIELPSLSSKLLKEDFIDEVSKIDLPDLTPKSPKIDVSYKPKEIEVPDITYEPPEVELPKLIEKRPSIEEEDWMTNVPVQNKILLGANGVNPSNFKYEKERHDNLNKEFGKDDSLVGNSLDDAFGPSSLGHTSLDRMLDEGREIMAAAWDDAMELGRKA